MTSFTISTQPIVASRPRPEAGMSWSGRGLRVAALSHLALFILIPLVVVAVEGFRHGLDTFWTNITRPAALSAMGLTVWTAALMMVINTIMGTLTAYVLVA